MDLSIITNQNPSDFVEILGSIPQVISTETVQYINHFKGRIGKNKTQTKIQSPSLIKKRINSIPVLSNSLALEYMNVVSMSIVDISSIALFQELVEIKLSNSIELPCLVAWDSFFGLNTEESINPTYLIGTAIDEARDESYEDDCRTYFWIDSLFCLYLATAGLKQDQMHVNEIWTLIDILVQEYKLDYSRTKIFE
ncbi:MAG: hypothetical protein ACRCXZ_00640 [Patescibacteria group bacterium]